MNAGANHFRLRRLSLAGFGFYQRPTRFLFPEGPGVLLGPNESGKSTFLAGLTAVLFGLPGVADPTRFGAARFRSFSRPEESWGELEWESNGHRYRLHRQFESHRVRLTEEEDGETRLLFDGEHNPQARSSAGSAFPREIREHLGLASLELFQETFCLSQPLPESGAIGRELQHLLSGSRAGRVDDVLNRLFQQIKELTRATGDLGLVRPGTSRPTNQRDDGSIEILERNLARARLEIEESRTVLNDLNVHNQELEEANEESSRLTSLIDAHARRLGTLQQWLEGNEERKRRLDRLGVLGKGLEELDRIHGERQVLEAELEGPWAQFRNAPQDLALHLESLERLEIERLRQFEDEERVRRARAAQLSEVRTLEERLATEFREVRGRGDLVELRERLYRAVARGDARRTEIASMLIEEEELLARAQAEAETMPGPSPETVEAEARAVLADFGRCRQIESRLDEIEVQLADRVFLSVGERLELLRQKIEAESTRKECGLRTREARAALALVRERAQKLESQLAAEALILAEKEPVPPAALRLIGKVRAWHAGLAAVGVGAGLYFALDRNLMAAGLGAVGLSFLYLLLKALTPQTKKRDESASGPTLDVVPGETAIRLESAQRTIREGEARLQEAESEEERLDLKVLELGQDLGPYAGGSGPELAQMKERWRLLDEERDRLLQERVQLLVRRLGVVPEQDWRGLALESLSGSFQGILDLRKLEANESEIGPGFELGLDLGGLLEWLVQVDEPVWTRLRRVRERQVASRSRIEILQRDLERLRKEEDEDDEALVLAQRLRPFSIKTDPEELARLCRECGETENALRSLRAQLSVLVSEESITAALHSAEEAVEAGWQELTARWPCERPAELLLEWIRRTREAERPARQTIQKLEELTRAADRVLRTSGVDSHLELERRRVEESAALGSLVRQLEQLEASEALLGAASGESDPAARALILQKLREGESAALERTRTRRDEMELQVRRLHREIAGLEGQGKKTPNLARLEIDVRRMEEDLHWLRRERGAIALAFRWIREAAEAFQNAYREDLEIRISERFAALTGVAGRRIVVDERFELEARDRSGDRLVLAQLSQGTRDQLLLAIRLAVADLLAAAVPLPFFFDDPFVHFDAERLKHLRVALQQVATERQWVLLTHREELAGWAERVRREPIEG